MNNKYDAQLSGTGVGLTLLTIVFLVLKLTNVIAWSWWWVLSPLWASFAVVFVVIVATMIFAVAKSK